ncbi:hypothetical protein OSB04_un000952 [Centaurea solstitialis]|uniref:Uncharacterized protein n=1 Tax=Centaurea solstitialis TaxID=347529 RepID=A0AA38W5E8_9ASTR|nr:hypothetical protein OSB04_un000952 [Centaurea solstitialis]
MVYEREPHALGELWGPTRVQNDGNKSPKLETVTMKMEKLKLDDQTLEESPISHTENLDCNGDESNSEVQSDLDQQTLPIFGKFEN